jgi:hypothetical protein
MFFIKFLFSYLQRNIRTFRSYTKKITNLGKGRKRKEKLNILKQMETNIDIKLDTKKKIPGKKLFMPEFQVKNKTRTSYLKLNILKENIPHTNALLTLEAG